MIKLFSFFDKSVVEERVEAKVTKDEGYTPEPLADGWP